MPHRAAQAEGVPARDDLDARRVERHQEGPAVAVHAVDGEGDPGRGQGEAAGDIGLAPVEDPAVGSPRRPPGERGAAVRGVAARLADEAADEPAAGDQFRGERAQHRGLGREEVDGVQVVHGQDQRHRGVDGRDPAGGVRDRGQVRAVAAEGGRHRQRGQSRAPDDVEALLREVGARRVVADHRGQVGHGGRDEVRPGWEGWSVHGQEEPTATGLRRRGGGGPAPGARAGGRSGRSRSRRGGCRSRGSRRARRRGRCSRGSPRRPSPACRPARSTRALGVRRRGLGPLQYREDAVRLLPGELLGARDDRSERHPDPRAVGPGREARLLGAGCRCTPRTGRSGRPCRAGRPHGPARRAGRRR